MATLYFTSNASSGDGTLAGVYATAESGDVIQPDPEVFPFGATIEIALTSALTSVGNITLDGAGRRIRLNGANAARGIVGGAYAHTFIDCDFVGFVGKAQTIVAVGGGQLHFLRSLIAGNSTSGTGIVYSSGAGTITLTDCAVYGNKAGSGAIYAAGTTTVTLTRSTVIGNEGRDVYAGANCITSATRSIYQSALNMQTATGCAVGAPSTIGFVVAPPDAVTFDADAWKSWNLRLASSSVYTTTEDALAQTFNDLDGNTRYDFGAIGAYETLQGVTWSADGATLTLEGAVFTNLTFAPENVVVSGVNFVDCLALTGDTSFSFATGAALGCAYYLSDSNALTLTGAGYFATPTGASLSGATVGDDIVLCKSGAGVTFFNAVLASVGTFEFYGTQTDPDVSVLLEYQGADGAWHVLDSDVTLSATAVTKTLAIDANSVTFRVYDGRSFTVDTAWLGTPTGVQFSVVTQLVEATQQNQNWECVFEVIGVDSDKIIRVGQAVTILARVFDAFATDTPLVNDGENIASVTYTCQIKKKEIFSTVWTDVPGHVNVEVEETALLESTQSSSAWTVDQQGFNFSLTPDVREHPLFPEVGAYRIVVTINLTEGNPVVFYLFIEVVDSAN